MAEADDYELTDVKWDHIVKARQYFDEFGNVPPIRKFAKYIEEDQNALFKIWMTGPMKPITKYGGLPSPPAAFKPFLKTPAIAGVFMRSRPCCAVKFLHQIAQLQLAYFRKLIAHPHHRFVNRDQRAQVAWRRSHHHVSLCRVDG